MKVSKANSLRQLLVQGKHALSSGRVCEAATLIGAQPALISNLLPLLWDDDPGVAMRAADVLERVTRDGSPALIQTLNRRRDALLGLMAETTLNKIRWNLALIVPRLALSPAQLLRTTSLLEMYLDDPGSIVKTAALQGLADLTASDAGLLPIVLDLLRVHGRSGTAAMRARSRILLNRLEKTSLRVPAW